MLNISKTNFSSLAINIQLFDKDRIKYEERKLEDILALWKANEIKCVFCYNRKAFLLNQKSL